MSERVLQRIARLDGKIDALMQYFSQRLEPKIDALRQEVRTFRLDDAVGDYLMARSMDDVLNKIREAKTVSESNNIAMREELKLLRAAKDDPAKIDEAIALIEGIMADDSAVLTENTPEAPAEPAEPTEPEPDEGQGDPPFTPSGN